MSSYSMPPDLKFEDIINGILAFSKSLRRNCCGREKKALDPKPTSAPEKKINICTIVDVK
jgi:hypothetical protein